MANAPLIHLVLGNVGKTGKTQFAALLADYFRHQGDVVRSVDVRSQGPGLSAYRTLEASCIHWRIDFIIEGPKELNRIFSFSPEVRVVDTDFSAFDMMVDFITEHRLQDFPGWMVHFPLTPASLKEARVGLLKLLPVMPFPLVFWLNGFRGEEAVRTILSTLTMAKGDVTGWVMIPERNATLSFSKERNLLLSDIESGQFGFAKVAEAGRFRAQIARQLDLILSRGSNQPV